MPEASTRAAGAALIHCLEHERQGARSGIHRARGSVLRAGWRARRSPPCGPRHPHRRPPQRPPRGSLGQAQPGRFSLGKRDGHRREGIDEGLVPGSAPSRVACTPASAASAHALQLGHVRAIADAPAVRRSSRPAATSSTQSGPMAPPTEAAAGAMSASDRGVQTPPGCAARTARTARAPRAMLTP